MTNEGDRLDKDVKRLEKELEQPITPARRRQIQEAIAHLRRKKRDWSMPH